MIQNSSTADQKMLQEYRENAEKYWNESNEIISECEEHFESSTFIDALKVQIEKLELAIAEVNKIPDQDKNDQDYRNLMSYHNNYAIAQEMVCPENRQMAVAELLYAAKYISDIKCRTVEDFSDTKDMYWSAKSMLEPSDPRYTILEDICGVLSQQSVTSIEQFERLSQSAPKFVSLLLNLIQDNNFPNNTLKSYLKHSDHLATFKTKKNISTLSYTDRTTRHLTFDYGIKNSNKDEDPRAKSVRGMT